MVDKKTFHQLQKVLKDFCPVRRATKIYNLEILATAMAAADEASSMHLHSSVGHSPLPETLNQTLLWPAGGVLQHHFALFAYWGAVERFLGCSVSVAQDPESSLPQVEAELISGRVRR